MREHFSDSEKTRKSFNLWKNAPKYHQHKIKRNPSGFLHCLGGQLPIQNKRTSFRISFNQFRRRPTFPGGCPPSIISAKKLNYCVRNGNRCDLLAIATEYMSITLRCVDSFLFVSQKLNQRSFRTLFFFFGLLHNLFRSSPRPISIGQLNTLPYLHLRPINHIVYVGSY